MTDNLHVRSRLALAVAGQKGADLGRGLVTEVSTPMAPGERIRRARAFRLLGLTVVDRAVLTELADGASWEVIATALRMDLERARRIYEPVWAAWQAGDFDNEADFGDYDLGPDGELDAKSVAQALDLWCAWHAEPQETEGASRTVSQLLVDGETAAGDR